MCEAIGTYRKSTTHDLVRNKLGWVLIKLLSKASAGHKTQGRVPTGSPSRMVRFEGAQLSLLKQVKLYTSLIPTSHAHIFGARPSKNRKGGSGKQGGGKCTLYVRNLNLAKPVEFFFTEPDMRKNVLSFPVGVYSFLK